MPALGSTRTYLTDIAGKNTDRLPNALMGGVRSGDIGYVGRGLGWVWTEGYVDTRWRTPATTMEGEEASDDYPQEKIGLLPFAIFSSKR